MNLGDWPLEKRRVSEDPLPLFSWCGSEDTRDIIMPTYDVTDSTLEIMGRWVIKGAKQNLEFFKMLSFMKFH